jgi:hypothetical protein
LNLNKRSGAFDTLQAQRRAPLAAFLFALILPDGKFRDGPAQGWQVVCGICSALREIGREETVRGEKRAGWRLYETPDRQHAIHGGRQFMPILTAWWIRTHSRPASVFASMCLSKKFSI